MNPISYPLSLFLVFFVNVPGATHGAIARLHHPHFGNALVEADDAMIEDIAMFIG